jgi:hypothetical protein
MFYQDWKLSDYHGTVSERPPLEQYEDEFVNATLNREIAICFWWEAKQKSCKIDWLSKI